MATTTAVKRAAKAVGGPAKKKTGTAPPAEARASPTTTRAKPPTGMPSAQIFRRCATKIAHLGESTRLQIFWCLARQPTNVGDLCVAIGAAQPAISHHLKLLRTAGFVDGERDGKNIVYSFTAPGRELWEGISGMLGKG